MQWAQTETQKGLSEHQEMLFLFFFFFTARLTEHWHRLPRKVVESLSLEIIKNNLDIVLGSWL